MLESHMFNTVTYDVTCIEFVNRAANRQLFVYGM